MSRQTGYTVAIYSSYGPVRPDVSYVTLQNLSDGYAGRCNLKINRHSKRRQRTPLILRNNDQARWRD